MARPARIAAATALAAVLLPPTPALAACTPLVDGRTLRITCDAGDDQVVLERDADGNVLVSGQPTGATVTTLDTIAVELGAGSDSVTIDETGGLLAPGDEQEAEGDPEIEVAIGIDPASTGDDLIILGQLVGDEIVIDDRGLDVNADGDVDVTPVGLDRLRIEASTGNDHVDASAFSRSSGGGFSSLDITGDEGFDTLIGGGGRDILAGGPDADRVSGGPGKDDVDGNEGNDLVAGGAGSDLVLGGNGRDALLGGLGDDELNGGSHRDTGNGGPGEDHCRQIEKATRCEAGAGSGSGRTRHD